MIHSKKPSQAEGFSLVELIITIAVLTIGLLSLAGTIGLSILNNSRSHQVLIAKYIAISTMETILAARESQILPYANIAPVSGMNPNGFLTGLQPVKLAGPDNIYGTADDAGDLVYTIGPKNINTNFNVATDQTIDLTLTGYQRRITITDMTDSQGSQFKQVDIEVFYPSPIGGQPSYKVTTYIGNYRLGS
jgi:prepilin-type N-terminal cleavage/methylation domain-containing protein